MVPLVVYRVYPDGRPDEMVRGVSIVGTPTEVVLKPPEPAMTSAWVDPERQGSINSGAVPPCPQERWFDGSKGPDAARSRSTR